MDELTYKVDPKKPSIPMALQEEDPGSITSYDPHTWQDWPGSFRKIIEQPNLRNAGRLVGNTARAISEEGIPGLGPLNLSNISPGGGVSPALTYGFGKEMGPIGRWFAGGQPHVDEIQSWYNTIMRQNPGAAEALKDTIIERVPVKALESSWWNRLLGRGTRANYDALRDIGQTTKPLQDFDHEVLGHAMVSNNQAMWSLGREINREIPGASKKILLKEGYESKVHAEEMLSGIAEIMSGSKKLSPSGKAALHLPPETFKKYSTIMRKIWQDPKMKYFEDIEPMLNKFKPKGRAEGGPVSKGEPYVVGEKGKELFIPKEEGDIIPLTKLSPKDEEAFQKNFKERAKNLGLNPNPDDPKHHYDARGAWKAGFRTTTGHLPDTWKLPGHPTFSVNSMHYRPGMKARIWGPKGTYLNLKGAYNPEIDPNKWSNKLLLEKASSALEEKPFDIPLGANQDLNWGVQFPSQNYGLEWSKIF